MLKRLFLALAFAGLLSPAYSAGTVPGYGPSQQLDNLGKPLANCFLYTIQAGTVSTPQNAYQDSGLTLVLPNPQRCNSAGRLPQFFLADGSIKIRLTDSNGVTIIDNDGILVVGASSGGGGGSPVDPTTILTTGDLKVTYGTGVLSGFVRANGRTVGSATSGATERANADTQALFQYLWGADANLVVSTGRGASAAADWAANKTIALPDFRSRALAGLGDMGNSDNALFSGVTFTSGSSTTLGSLLGAARRTLPLNSLPATSPWAISDTTSYSFTFSLASTNSTGPGLFVNNIVPTGGGSGTVTPVKAGSVTLGSNAGGGAAFDSVSTYALVTLYVKL